MPRIEDYALIGDCQSAALVSREGSIDWLCWPRFDSEACFCALLGEPDHGFWSIEAVGGRAAGRAYRSGSLVLDTDYEAPGGKARLTDFMPLRDEDPKLVRRIEGIEGETRLRLRLRPRFDYGRIKPWIHEMDGGGVRAIAGPHSVILEGDCPLRIDQAEIHAEFTVRAGQTICFVLTYEPSHVYTPELCEPAHSLQATLAFWREWSGKSRYRGRWSETVNRSLITIKALTYAPTGGIIAAPTTSLPEKIGGPRNWDYRFCWLRDATFSVLSLMNAGYRSEAEAWCDWLLRAVAGDAAQVQPLYGIAGEHRLEERELDWLPGYRGSRPVRIGNGAYDQLQIDVFGGVMDALHQARGFDLDLREQAWPLQKSLVDELEGLWSRPDEGIWEVRSEPRHFVHSKVLAWTAFDRAVRAVEDFGCQGPVDRWRRLRDEIHAEVCERGFSERAGAFVQSYDSDALDAAALLIPLVGFLPATDPRMLRTVEAIQQRLTDGGLVLRYDPDVAEDGVGGGEGAFLACSFWLADNLLLQGRRGEAEALFDRLAGLCNDVGLLAEQYDPHQGRQLGNFPQAFSHFALIDTAFNLSDEKAAAEPDRPAA